MNLWFCITSDDIIEAILRCYHHVKKGNIRHQKVFNEAFVSQKDFMLLMHF